MSDLSPTNGGDADGTAVKQEGALFGGAPAESAGLPMAAWGVAAAIIVIIVGALALTGRHGATVAPNTPLPADAYAASLPLTQLAMSESSSLSGSKLTYLDGHIQNTGGSTVSSVTVQVVFANDTGMAPQIDTVPMTLIRMRQPYIDTEAVSAEPIKPAEEREFRLIFENVPENWNTQMPEVRIVRTGLR